MPDLPAEAGEVLCGLARRAIAARCGIAADVRTSAHRDLDGPRTWLDAPGASFVTLTRDGRLRGCIGSLTATRPLRDDVAANAVRAAFHDPRFAPLAADDLPRTRIEVSVLSAPEPFPVASRADAVSRLRPGVDGVILGYGSHRGTFLPQVWHQLPDPDDFLAALVRKAGLPDGWWDDTARLSRYTVTAFEEP